MTAEALARRRARYLTGLAWHAGAYVILSACFAGLDLLGDRMFGWSIWIMAVWGLALAFHGLAYLVDGTGLEARRTRAYLRKRNVEKGPLGVDGYQGVARRSP